MDVFPKARPSGMAAKLLFVKIKIAPQSFFNRLMIEF